MATPSPTVEELAVLGRRDLQKWAKKFGIRANQKSDQLREEITSKIVEDAKAASASETSLNAGADTEKPNDSAADDVAAMVDDVSPEPQKVGTSAKASPESTTSEVTESASAPQATSQIDDDGAKDGPTPMSDDAEKPSKSSATTSSTSSYLSLRAEIKARAEARLAADKANSTSAATPTNTDTSSLDALVRGSKEFFDSIHKRDHSKASNSIEEYQRQKEARRQRLVSGTPRCSMKATAASSAKKKRRREDADDEVVQKPSMMPAIDAKKGAIASSSSSSGVTSKTPLKKRRVTQAFDAGVPASELRFARGSATPKRKKSKTSGGAATPLRRSAAKINASAKKPFVLRPPSSATATATATAASSTNTKRDPKVAQKRRRRSRSVGTERKAAVAAPTVPCSKNQQQDTASTSTSTTSSSEDTERVNSKPRSATDKDKAAVKKKRRRSSSMPPERKPVPAPAQASSQGGGIPLPRVAMLTPMKKLLVQKQRQLQKEKRAQLQQAKRDVSASAAKKPSATSVAASRTDRGRSLPRASSTSSVSSADAKSKPSSSSTLMKTTASASRKSLSNRRTFPTLGGLKNEKKVPVPRKKFDLEASLARPLTWKRHTGPIPALKESAEERKAPSNPTTHTLMQAQALTSSSKKRRRAASCEPSRAPMTFYSKPSQNERISGASGSSSHSVSRERSLPRSFASSHKKQKVTSGVPSKGVPTGSAKRPTKFGFGVGAPTKRTFKATTPFGGDKKGKRDALAKRQGEHRAAVVEKMRGEKAAVKVNEKENVPQAAQ